MTRPLPYVGEGTILLSKKGEHMIKLEIDVTFTQGKKGRKSRSRNVSVDVEDRGYLWNYQL